MRFRQQQQRTTPEQQRISAEPISFALPHALSLLSPSISLPSLLSLPLSQSPRMKNKPALHLFFQLQTIKGTTQSLCLCKGRLERETPLFVFFFLITRRKQHRLSVVVTFTLSSKSVSFLWSRVQFEHQSRPRRPWHRERERERERGEREGERERTNIPLPPTTTDQRTAFCQFSHFHYTHTRLCVPPESKRGPGRERKRVPSMC